jgi:indole-3-glycerol phosphate synthase
MVERKKELRRRYHRKGKMRKLKAKLAHTTAEADRQMIIAKIKRLSPDWDPSVVLSRTDQ